MMSDHHNFHLLSGGRAMDGWKDVPAQEEDQYLVSLPPPPSPRRSIIILYTIVGELLTVHQSHGDPTHYPSTSLPPAKFHVPSVHAMQIHSTPLDDGFIHTVFSSLTGCD